jgi:hypothetical protein
MVAALSIDEIDDNTSIAFFLPETRNRMPVVVHGLSSVVDERTIAAVVVTLQTVEVRPQPVEEHVPARPLDLARRHLLDAQPR